MGMHPNSFGCGVDGAFNEIKLIKGKRKNEIKMNQIEGKNWFIGATFGIIGVLIGVIFVIATKTGVMWGVIALISAGLAVVALVFQQLSSILAKTINTKIFIIYKHDRDAPQFIQRWRGWGLGLKL